MYLINNNDANTNSKIASYISNLLTKQLRNTFTKITFVAACVAISSNAYSKEEETASLSSRSISVERENELPAQYTHDNVSVANDASQAALIALNSMQKTPANRKSRAQVITERKKELPSKTGANNKLSSHTLQSGNYVEFTIYDATTRLFEDFDYDGYYQTFSVTFDADVLSDYAHQQALVYADMYLSRNGGPWELYFTTEPFTIINDSSEDKFEVLTTLDLGYRTNHYDVLIDLYEVGYSDIVASKSSDDIEGLYALPLESTEHNEYHEAETHTSSVTIRGGSVSVLALLFVVGVWAARVRSFLTNKLFC